MATRKLVVEIVGDADSLTRTFTKASSATSRFGRDVNGAERTISRATRGAVAGSGAFRGLGRSIAFASGGFIAFASVGQFLRSSIDGAESLEKATRGLDAALAHTGGNTAKLKRGFEDVAAGARRFGIDQATATVELNRALVLSGDAASAQRAYSEALVISKATGKDFNTVLTATAKGQEGVTTSLQRYGILIAKGTPGQQQYLQVMSRFAGQAKANTSGIDVFNATLRNSEEIIGAGILPLVNKYLGELGDWLNRMNRSGQLQRDVNHYLKIAQGIFGDLGHVVKIAAGAVRFVDRVTGGFVNTLEILIGLKVATMIWRWSFALDGLITSLGLATAAETTFGAAAVTAGAEAAAAGAEAKIAAGLFGSLAGAAGAAAAVAAGVVFGLSGDQSSGGVVVPKGAQYVQPSPFGDNKFYFKNGHWYEALSTGQSVQLTPAEVKKFHLHKVNAPVGPTGPVGPHGGSSGTPSSSPYTSPTTTTASATGAASSFSLPYRLRLAQAKAQSTVSNSDDLSVARQIKAFLLRVIPKLHGDKLLQAYQELGQVNQQLASAVQSAANIAQDTTYTLPLRLQLLLARAQAFGGDQNAILLKMKAALLKALKAAKGNTQKQIDILNQIASINDQLGSSASTALGKFKQLDINKIVRRMHLTVEQANQLRAALSQVGPGGTVPGSGVGAAGYIIGRDDRPIVIHHVTKLDGKEIERNTTKHQQHRHRRNPHQRRGPHAGR